MIKAWCFYESRILGAHHGLISTYALETLVLYIFHVFNNCFTGPLEVTTGSCTLLSQHEKQFLFATYVFVGIIPFLRILQQL